MFSRGDPLERVWLIDSGRVALSATTREGLPHACSSRGEGAALGLEGLGGVPAQRDAVVAEGAELRSASVEEVLGWIGAGERVWVELMAEELARCAAERALPVGDAVERVARYLLGVADEALLSGWRGARLWEVACLLNIRPETLSRALRELESRGLIEDGREPRVKDREGLMAVADPQ